MGSHKIIVEGRSCNDYKLESERNIRPRRSQNDCPCRSRLRGCHRHCYRLVVELFGLSSQARFLASPAKDAAAPRLQIVRKVGAGTPTAEYEDRSCDLFRNRQRDSISTTDSQDAGMLPLHDTHYMRAIAPAQGASTIPEKNEILTCHDRATSLSERSRNWLRPRNKTDQFLNGFDYEPVTLSGTRALPSGCVEDLKEQDRRQKTDRHVRRNNE